MHIFFTYQLYRYRTVKMDHPNVSFRFNNMENSFHQPAFDNPKNTIHGDAKDCSGDSGYMTNLSMSNSAASSSRIGNLTGSSFKRSLDLAPITELHELSHTDAPQQPHVVASFAAIETPTTKSIRQLTAFHINTPPPSRSDTTPTKSNYFAQIHHSGGGGGGSSCKKPSHRHRFSPYKHNGQTRSPRERRNLFDTNNENEFVPNVHEVTIGFSPIGAYDSGSAKLASSKVRPLHRHPSGIESSTPKASVLRRIQTQAVVRPAHESFVDTRSSHIIRKTQSFGPNKQVVRASSASSAQHRAHAVASKQLAEASNPASMMLKLSNEQFHQLLGSHVPTGLQTPTKQQPAIGPMEASAEKSRQSSYKRKVSSRLLRDFSRKRTLRPVTRTKSPTGTLNESDILMALGEDISGCEAAKPLQSTELDVAKTPNVSRSIGPGGKSDTPHRDDSMTQSMRIEANRTPIKRFDRSISFNPSHRRFSPEKEKNKKMYGRLPCTPPKNYAKRPLKRAANKSVDADAMPVTPEPSAKRKLYEAGATRSVFYNDKYTRMDIITHLANFNLSNITANIFKRLSERELQAVRSTCRSWSGIVQQDKLNNARRRQFVSAAQSIKENSYTHRNHSASISSIGELNSTHDVSLKRRPFNMSNIQNSVTEKSEPVNLSLLRFQKNQEVSYESMCHTALQLQCIGHV